MIIWQTDRADSAPYVVLRRGPAGWLADFANTDHADFLRKHLGSAIVPLPFTLEADPIEVYNVIKARNPEYLIYVR